MADNLTAEQIAEIMAFAPVQTSVVYSAEQRSASQARKAERDARHADPATEVEFRAALRRLHAR